MKIKKFNEKYDLDIDGDEITIEYAKVIISAYIDKKNEESLESVFLDVIKGDDLDDDRAEMIKVELLDYLKNLYNDARVIRKIHEIEADRYNL